MEGAFRPALAWADPRTWLRLGILAGLYFALAWLGLRFAGAEGIASPVWPPAGLAVVAVTLWGLRAVPAIVVAAACVEMAAGVAPTWALAMGLGNGSEAALGGWL